MQELQGSSPGIFQIWGTSQWAHSMDWVKGTYYGQHYENRKVADVALPNNGRRCITSIASQSGY